MINWQKEYLGPLWNCLTKLNALFNNQKHFQLYFEEKLKGVYDYVEGCSGLMNKTTWIFNKFHTNL